METSVKDANPNGDPCSYPTYEEWKRKTLLVYTVRFIKTLKTCTAPCPRSRISN
ncbi:hypothetical protein [Defluviitoga tunisiensis]|uniref:hypothetical protein n=1 Tax=Defluviitoga tunisiensis TaxID=1006576 RepID=UPI001494EE67|nr:hypothetical protein [Defluviitoga tunisiensis]